MTGRRDPGRPERHTIVLPATTWLSIREAARAWGTSTKDLWQQAGEDIAERYATWLETGHGWRRKRRPTELQTKDQYRDRARVRADQPAWPPQRAVVTAGLPPSPVDIEDPGDGLALRGRAIKRNLKERQDENEKD